MRTACSSSCWGGPEHYPPQFPPWVWAWTWSPWISPLGVARTWSSWISPLGVGLDLIPSISPFGCGPGDPLEQAPTWEQVPPQDQTPWDQTPPRTRHPPGPDPPDQTPLGSRRPLAADPPTAGTPPRGQNSWHTLLKILPCPKLRLWAVNMFHYYLWVGICSMKSMVIDTYLEIVMETCFPLLLW